MRPRVDLQVTYTKFPAKKSDAFPDIDRIWLPALNVLLVSGKKSIGTIALLDTGAGVCLFGTEHAEALGIDWRNCPSMEIRGVGGEATGYAADVKLVIPAAKYAWPARVVFSPGTDKAPLPLLGHHGFFEYFEVRFVSSAKQFRVHLK